MESRISIDRIAPYGKVYPGDMVFIKRSSGPVEAIFTVGCVELYDLAETPIELLKERYSAALCADDAFFHSKQRYRYAVIMEIKDLTHLNPFSIDKKGMQTWLLLWHSPIDQGLDPTVPICYTFYANCIRRFVTIPSLNKTTDLYERSAAPVPCLVPICKGGERFVVPPLFI